MEHNYYQEIHNCSTGETIIVPLTAEELARFQPTQIAVETRKVEEKTVFEEQPAISAE
jgi:hypothetical protein